MKYSNWAEAQLDKQKKQTAACHVREVMYLTSGPVIFWSVYIVTLFSQIKWNFALNVW